MPLETLTIFDSENTLIEALEQNTLVEIAEQQTLVEVAEQGPPGPAGPVGPAGASALTATAGQALGGHRAVILDALNQAFYADNTVQSQSGRLAGLTTAAVVLGAVVTIISSGVMIEPSWAWSTNFPVYLSSNGLLTQTLPMTGFLQIVGIALSPNTIFISPREPLATL